MLKPFYLLAASIVLIGNLALASGVMNIDGSVYGFDNKQIMIRKADRVYYIEKSKLSPQQKKQIKRLKVGSKITLPVSFTAVKNMKMLKPKAKKN